MTDSYHHGVVAPAATLSQLGVFFRRSNDYVIAQLFERARRAGATSVYVMTKLSPTGDMLVSIMDNGKGSNDLTDLMHDVLSISPRSLSRSEADFEFLNAFRIFIRSKAPHDSEGWRTQLGDDECRGITDPIFRPAICSSTTEFAFSAGNDRKIVDTIQRIARHVPIEVLLDGDPVDQKGFLDGAVLIQEWRGCRIGVFTGDASVGEPNLSYFGQTRGASLPKLPSLSMPDGHEKIFGPSLHVKVDVTDDAETGLAPQRPADVIEEACLPALSIEAEKALYRAVAALPDHCLPYEDLNRARDLDIQLKPAVPTWAAYPSGGNPFKQGEPVVYASTRPDHAIIVDVTLTPEETRSLLRAFDLSAPEYVLLQPSKAHKGCKWYDDTPKLTHVEWFVKQIGATTPLRNDLVPAVPFADDLHAIVTIEGPGERLIFKRIATDLFYHGGHLEELPWTAPLIAKDAEFDAEFLKDDLAEFFSSQRNEFSEADVRRRLHEATLKAEAITDALFTGAGYARPHLPDRLHPRSTQSRQRESDNTIRRGMRRRLRLASIKARRTYKSFSRRFRRLRGAHWRKR